MGIDGKRPVNDTLIARLTQLARNAHNHPLAAETVVAAIGRISYLEGYAMALKELIDKLESTTAAATEAVKTAAAEELKSLTASGRLLSESDFAALQAELKKNGLDANGQPLPPAPAA